MPTETELQAWLELAKQGDRDALGKLLQHFRPELRDMARRRITGALQARIDGSDLVQQSCLSAVRNFAGFGGTTLPEFVAWLKQIHERNIADIIRNHAVYEKRAIGREEPEHDGTHQAGAHAATPSQQAIHGERVAQVAAALEELPTGQREAVQLRHLEGCSLAEIARRLGRTEDAVIGLLWRGLRTLRRKLKEE